MNRRDVLQRCGIGGVATLLTGLAGCIGNDGTSGENGPDEEDGLEDGPDDEEDDDADDGPDDDISNYDPESVAQEYYEALDAGDGEKLTELSHSQGIAIENVSFNADAWGDQEDITVKDGEIIIENLNYFYYPSAVVDISFDLIREDTSDIPRSNEVILAVEDEELRVFDTNGDDDETETGDPDGPCPPEDDGDALENLPRTSESFYRVTRDARTGSAEAYYRGPDNDRFNIELEVHDTEDEAEEVSASGTSNYNRNGESWEGAEYLVGRTGNVTCEIDVDNSAVAEQMDLLFEQVNCFNDEHVVDRTDA